MPKKSKEKKSENKIQKGKKVKIELLEESKLEEEIEEDKISIIDNEFHEFVIPSRRTISPVLEKAESNIQEVQDLEKELFPTTTQQEAPKENIGDYVQASRRDYLSIEEETRNRETSEMSRNGGRVVRMPSLVQEQDIGLMSTEVSRQRHLADIGGEIERKNLPTSEYVVELENVHDEVRSLPGTSKRKYR